MGGLLAEMNRECNANGARFCVLILPNKAALCSGRQPADASFGMSYNQEAAVVSKLCRERSIDVIDSEQPATQLRTDEKNILFFTVHLSPFGHQHVANVLMPYVTQQLDSTAQTTAH